MDPEPRGCDAGGAVGKGYPIPLMIAMDTQPRLILTLSLSVSRGLLVARGTLVRCSKERCSGTKRLSPSKPAKKICLQS